MSARGGRGSRRAGVGGSLGVALALIFGATGPLAGQWVMGVHRTASPAAADRVAGFGARGGLAFGPFAVAGVVDWYRVHCADPAEACHDRAAAIHASFEVPAPAVRPYLVAGVGVRDRAPVPDEARRITLLGFGLRLAVVGFDLFGEATGERMADHDTRLVVRVGVRF